MSKAQSPKNNQNSNPKQCVCIGYCIFLGHWAFRAAPPLRCWAFDVFLAPCRSQSLSLSRIWHISRLNLSHSILDIGSFLEPRKGLYKRNGVDVYLVRYSKYHKIHAMKKTYRTLLMAAIGSALLAGLLLPAFSTRARQRPVRIQSVNNIAPVFFIGTNVFISTVLISNSPATPLWPASPPSPQ
jgi:hypothetical protein